MAGHESGAIEAVGWETNNSYIPFRQRAPKGSDPWRQNTLESKVMLAVKVWTSADGLDGLEGGADLLSLLGSSVAEETTQGLCGLTDAMGNTLDRHVVCVFRKA